MLNMNNYAINEKYAKYAVLCSDLHPLVTQKCQLLDAWGCPAAVWPVLHKPSLHSAYEILASTHQRVPALTVLISSQLVSHSKFQSSLVTYSISSETA
jgi:hypothetical protein